MFKNGDFDVEGKYRSRRSKIYEDAELEELSEEDSSQTQKELALILEVIRIAIRIKAKRREHRLYNNGMLLARHKKRFLYRIVTGDEKRIHYDNSKKKENHGDYLATRRHLQQNRIFMEKKLMLCI
ncbi:Mariner Mos1 transposase [Eumeta japonica]|uniref:Mariner Mos1 transposase n=1 Tax=Eumeta variegata TaxID=151549 RepID=A0A4C1YB65_EUMVA|nr:Mariner Mos1 transposase [Eumeta japonica]